MSAISSRAWAAAAPGQPRMARAANAEGLLPQRQLVLGAGVAAASLVGSAAPARHEEADAWQPPATPAEALEILYAGNHRFAAGRPSAARRDMQRVKEVADRQQPFAAVLGCADSRVPIEIVFDQGFGDLFVNRIAGNVATNENIGSIEFASLVLGIKVIYVLGHTACGAVTAALTGDEVPGQISGLFQHLRPAVRASGGDLDVAVRANVVNQAQTIAESSPVIARLIREKRVTIAGGVYDLQTSVVTPVEIPAA